MIAPKCVGCGDELDEPGGILLSPPASIDDENVRKRHLCVHCYGFIDRLVEHLAKRREDQLGGW